MANFRPDEKFEWPLSSHGSGQRFGAVHTELSNRDWRCSHGTVELSKASMNAIRKSMFAISVCNFSFLFQLSNDTPMQPRLCRTKRLAGHGVHILPFKFSTVPVKNLTPILAVKFLNG